MDDPLELSRRRPPERLEPSAEEERDAAVEAVLRLVEERLEAQAAARRARPVVTPVRAALAAVSLVLAAVAWAVPESWIGPAALPDVDPVAVESGLRLAMAAQVERIRIFRSDRGRLPDALRETGVPPDGLEYRRLDARSYLLRGRAEGVVVEYRSGDSLAELWPPVPEESGPEGTADGTGGR